MSSASAPACPGAQALVVCGDFDGTEYGDDYLVFQAGAMICPVPHPEENQLWAFGEIGSGADLRRGWYPADWAD